MTPPGEIMARRLRVMLWTAGCSPVFRRCCQRAPTVGFRRPAPASSNTCVVLSCSFAVPESRTFLRIPGLGPGTVVELLQHGTILVSRYAQQPLAKHRGEVRGVRCSWPLLPGRNAR